MTMSKRSALSLATGVITQIDGCNPNWRFRVPVSAKDLQGATRTVTAETYALARRRRTEEVVQLALTLMGIHGTIEFTGIETGSAIVILDRVLADPDEYICIA